MKYIKLLIFLNQIIKIFLDYCSNYDEYYSCSLTSIATEQNEWDKRCFQTPRKNGTDYYETYQDMHYLMG